MRHKKVQKREVTPDRIYNSILVTKLINRVMYDGKKSTAEHVLYNAFDKLTEKGLDPLQTFEKAVATVSPKVEVRPRRVGGANYQVPVEVRGERKTTLALRWILEAARARSNKEYHTFQEKLVAELLDILENKGDAVKKRDNTLRQAEANRAFAHFRW